MLQTRERRSELLARADADELAELAERCLGRGDVALAGPVTVGTLRLQVREPVVGDRFVLTDVLACRAEVVCDGRRGWAMRLGDDRRATLAAAVCDLEAATDGPFADEVDALCRRTASRLEAARADEWRELEPTEVRFEELEG